LSAAEQVIHVGFDRQAWGYREGVEVWMSSSMVNSFIVSLGYRNGLGSAIRGNADGCQHASRPKGKVRAREVEMLSKCDGKASTVEVIVEAFAIRRSVSRQ
jgi:hypothetical protein